MDFSYPHWSAVGDYRSMIGQYVEGQSYPANYTRSLQLLLTLEFERRLVEQVRSTAQGTGLGRWVCSGRRTLGDYFHLHLKGIISVLHVKQ
jgi:hypothetical protein